MSIDVSRMPKLGFGLMRLPQKDDKIDLDQLMNMVDMYMEAGLNYFDTAYVYHGGMSEVAARKALVERYPRDSFRIATKLPAWEMKEEADRDRIFQEQLERAGVEYFDFYLLHSIEDGNVDMYEKLDCFRWGVEKKKEGKIRHFGFSFHGSPALLVRLLDEHPEVEFVQIQLNYIDWNNQIVHSGELYEILEKRNIPVIVMEPCKGGTLAGLKPELEERYKTIRPDKSIASWAFRFAASLPGVMTILSGMSTEDQMKDNISTFTKFEPLSDEEWNVLDKVRSIMLDILLIGCTSCRYCCDGCPSHISIPDVFRAVNTMTLHDEEFRPRAFYRGMLKATSSGKASDCIACGQCESVCPQHLPIIELMKDAAAKLEV